MYDEWGFRDYRSYPPTVAEVQDWRRKLQEEARFSIMVSYTGWGFATVAAMSGAEKRYEAMGLL
jgi:hypothetical protein